MRRPCPAQRGAGKILCLSSASTCSSGKAEPSSRSTTELESAERRGSSHVCLRRLLLGGLGAAVVAGGGQLHTKVPARGRGGQRAADVVRSRQAHQARSLVPDPHLGSTTYDPQFARAHSPLEPRQAHPGTAQAQPRQGAGTAQAGRPGAEGAASVPCNAGNGGGAVPVVEANVLRADRGDAEGRAGIRSEPCFGVFVQACIEERG